MQLADSASNKLNEIEVVASRPAGAEEDGARSPTFRPKGVRLTPEQAADIDRQDGLAAPSRPMSSPGAGPQQVRKGADSDEHIYNA